MISSSSYSTQSIHGGRLSWEFFMAIPRWWSKQWLIKSFADKSIAPHGHQFESPLYKFRLFTGTAFSSNLLICSISNWLLRNLSIVGPRSLGLCIYQWIFHSKSELEYLLSLSYFQVSLRVPLLLNLVIINNNYYSFFH